MKKISNFFIFLIVVMLSVVCIAEEISNDSEPLHVTIGEILEQPDTYAGQNVTFTGTISSECGSGCWFIIGDDTGEIYVNIRPNNFTIPPAMGKEATVTGKVQKKDDTYLVGSQVVIGDTVYP